MSLNRVISDLNSYLEWKRDEGETSVTVSPDVVAELGRLATEDRGVGTPPPIKDLKNKNMELACPQAGGVVKMSPSAPAPPAVVHQKREVIPMKDGDSLENIAVEIQECTTCSLHKVRNNTVPGNGQTVQPDILFVGEAPGADEDEQGIPFVGRSGKLLTKMIEAMGYSRETVFIANINKCRPPDNRKPTPEEMKVCLPFLKRQIAVLQPKVIVAMGATAVVGLVGISKGESITTVRGKWQKFEGIDLMPTFHPAYMLRNPNMKRPVWDDLKNVLKHLGKTVPAVKKA